MFFWRVSTFLELLRRFLPATHAALAELATTIGTRRYQSKLRKIYPQLESISVDYAIVEPASRLHPAPVSRNRKASSGPQTSEPSVSVILADIGWSDIGSWNAVYELLAKPGANFSAGPSVALDATGNFLWSPKKFVGVLGVHDMILVETDDAILICPRRRSQDVAKIVKWLEHQKLKSLL